MHSDITQRERERERQGKRERETRSVPSLCQILCSAFPILPTSSSDIYVIRNFRWGNLCRTYSTVHATLQHCI